VNGDSICGWLFRVVGGCCFAVTIVAISSASDDATRRLQRERDNSGMVFIRGGEHKTRVRSFYLDQHEVTNAQFNCALVTSCWSR